MNFRDLAAARICFVRLKITWCEWARSEVGKPICLFRISVWSNTHLLRGRNTWPFIITSWINYYLWLRAGAHLKYNLSQRLFRINSKKREMLYDFYLFIFFFEQWITIRIFDPILSFFFLFFFNFLIPMMRAGKEFEF